MKATKVTFKNGEKETGLARIVRPYPETRMRLNKRVFGTIHPPTAMGADTWSISIMVMKETPDDNPNCDWKSITFAKKFDTLILAKEFIQEKIDYVLSKYTLKFMED
jgi:hypothetical protein